MQKDISPSIAPESLSESLPDEVTRKRDKSKLSPVKLDCRGRVICKENGNTGARVARWRVTFGKRITGGKKERKFFDTEKEAREEIAKRMVIRKKEGDDATAISVELRGEAIRCVEKLKPSGASLTQAVDFFLKHTTPPGGERLKFHQVMDRFLAERSSSFRETSLKSFKSRLGIVSRTFGKRAISEIGTLEIKQWLAKEERAPKTRNNFIGDLSNLFNFAITEKYCGFNPVADIKTSKVRHKEPQKLTPAQARNLLLAAMVEAPEMVAGLAIALFAGLRRSELCALDWSNVHLKEREIIVTFESAKVSRRTVTIQDNLALWLEPYVRESGPVLYFKAQFSDALCPMDKDTFGKKLKKLIDGDGERPAIISPWPDNAIRHSFCSYHYGRTKNINLTAAEAGNSARMIDVHYRGLVREAEVKEYWNIVPTGEAANVLPMVAA